MLGVSGLEALQTQLEQAQQAFEELDGEMCAVNVNLHDPASIEAAIQQVNAVMDARVSAWADNPMVGQVAAGMKEQYREAIIEQAAAARREADSQ